MSGICFASQMWFTIIQVCVFKFLDILYIFLHYFLHSVDYTQLFFNWHTLLSKNVDKTKTCHTHRISQKYCRSTICLQGPAIVGPLIPMKKTTVPNCNLLEGPTKSLCTDSNSKNSLFTENRSCWCNIWPV